MQIYDNRDNRNKCFSVFVSIVSIVVKLHYVLLATKPPISFSFLKTYYPFS